MTNSFYGIKEEQVASHFQCLEKDKNNKFLRCLIYFELVYCEPLECFNSIPLQWKFGIITPKQFMSLVFLANIFRTGCIPTDRDSFPFDQKLTRCYYFHICIPDIRFFEYLLFQYLWRQRNFQHLPKYTPFKTFQSSHWGYFKRPSLNSVICAVNVTFQHSISDFKVIECLGSKQLLHFDRHFWLVRFVISFLYLSEHLLLSNTPDTRIRRFRWPFTFIAIDWWRIGCFRDNHGYYFMIQWCRNFLPLSVIKPLFISISHVVKDFPLDFNDFNAFICFIVLLLPPNTAVWLPFRV